jgi:hypothetical protein
LPSKNLILELELEIVIPAMQQAFQYKN